MTAVNFPAYASMRRVTCEHTSTAPGVFFTQRICELLQLDGGGCFAGVPGEVPGAKAMEKVVEALLGDLGRHRLDTKRLKTERRGQGGVHGRVR